MRYVVVTIVLLCAALPSAAQVCGMDEYIHYKDKAAAADEANNFYGFLHVLEAWVKACPTDGQAHYFLASTVYLDSIGVEDEKKGRAMRLRARDLLHKSKELGWPPVKVDALLSQIPADGNLPVRQYSAIAEANRWMRVGEGAFARRDYEKAKAGYIQAFATDPKIYEAAYMAGESHVALRSYAAAGEWYARAVAIDPESEAAYRGWSSALLAAGDSRGAREKAVEAVLAEPYADSSWAALSVWAEAAGQHRLNTPVVIPAAEIRTSKSPDGKTLASVTIDPLKLLNKDDQVARAAWTAYGNTRAQWIATKFAQRFPQETAYRHSLAEETEAMNAALAAALDGSGKLTTSDRFIKTLAELKSKGLIEAFLLLHRPTNGTAKDYVAYRSANRAKLKQYLQEFVLAPAK